MTRTFPSCGQVHPSPPSCSCWAIWSCRRRTSSPCCTRPPGPAAATPARQPPPRPPPPPGPAQRRELRQAWTWRKRSAAAKRLLTSSLKSPGQPNFKFLTAALIRPCSRILQGLVWVVGSMRLDTAVPLAVLPCRRARTLQAPLWVVFTLRKDAALSSACLINRAGGLLMAGEGASLRMCFGNLWRRWCFEQARESVGSGGGASCQERSGRRRRT